jgi:uncharacterized protein (DUF486 family)
MRRAPEILFVVSILFLVGSTVFALLSAQETMQLANDMPLPISVRIAWFIKVFVTPLAPAALPLFGAGILWRMDRRAAPSATAEVAE